MTSPPREATTLTVDHRAAQVVISRRVAAQVLQLWGEVDPRAVDRSWPLVARAVANVVERGYTDSVVAAADYLRQHAARHGVDLRAALAGPLDGEQLATALRVTGPVAVKIAAANGRNAVDAGRAAAVQIVGSSTRLALLGGRATTAATVNERREILGWRRVGVGASCAFCSMLIGRGAVYKSAQTAGASAHAFIGDGVAKFHDHDDCQVEPLYVGDAEPLDVAEHFARYVAAA